MMNLINNLSLLITMISLLFLVLYPRIKLPISIDLLAWAGVIGSFALLINSTYVSYRNAEILFRCVMSCLVLIATYRQYIRSINK